MTIATLLVLAATSPLPQTFVTQPTQPVELVVIGPDSNPIRGVTVTLLRCTHHEDDTTPSHMIATDQSGAATVEMPEPGEYILRFVLPGFLTTTLGPFTVCPPDQVACGPSMVTPTTVLLPEAAFVD